MKLDRLQEYVTGAVILLLGIGFALYCGSLIGGGNTHTLGLIFTGILILALCISMRTSVWLLVPLCWELTGKVTALNVPLLVRDMAVLVAFGSYLIFYALKLLRAKPVFDLIDLLVIANLAYLATVFLRNPVGAKWFGSDMVGGRPYFDIFIAFLAFTVLKRAPLDLKTVRLLPLISLLGAAFVSLGSMITLVWPSTASPLGRVYSSFAPPELQSGQIINEDVIGRRPLFAVVGQRGMQLLSSYFSPFSFLSPHNPLRFFAAIAFTACILLSGFRSALFTIFVYVCLSSYFRKRKQDIIFFCLIASAFVGVAALGNGRLFTLPLSAQRALSFLPGDWDYEAVSDARSSSEWRYQMWNMVMTEEKWIKNKWLGDGFGFTRYELGIMESVQGFTTGVGQEAFLISGTYHSGPLSAIRYAGLVGLALFAPLMILLVVRAYRLIRACYGTTLFPVALFVGMPMVFAPFPFIFVAGGYDSSMAEAFFSAGLLKILERAHASLLAATETGTNVRRSILARPAGHRPGVMTHPRGRVATAQLHNTPRAGDSSPR